MVSHMIPKDKLKTLFDKKQYEVDLFKKEGFTRHKCKVCGSYFWGLNSDLEICGDTSCIGGYRFLIKKNNFKKWDLHETINNWTEFFKVKGHTRINDYPVVARWRDDIFFTIASIADFQPWVLNGTIDPPANPLVVPQPCVRFGGKGFCDIDNVGKTGRHLSLFIMGGQHSFNSERRKIKGYWMDRCIDLNYDFLVNVLKTNKEELTYREDIWQGGGNFGPSLEVFYKGLEVVNNVFMQYEVLPDNSYQEMDFKVIDVGWGLERITWLSQGTPTVYDAAFGNVVDKIKRKIGLKIPDKLINDYSIVSGLIDRDGLSNNKSFEDIKNMGDYNLKEIEELIEPLQAVYAIADHLRTFVFALSDGAIPSNVGGGYNVRTMLRRVYSLNKIYSLDLDIAEICFDHIKFLKKSYPRITDAESTINELLDLEKRRYQTTLDKGRKYVESLFNKKEKIDEVKIREIYESRGIPPEMVKKIANELNKEITIPTCFYVDLDKKQEQIPASDKEEKKFMPFIINLTPTQKLFYENSYKQEFKAKVLRKILKKFIVLDKTLFYPLGGGQIGDTGFINNSKVLRSFKIGDIIIHELDDIKDIKENDIINGKIDWNRRIQLMQHHTAAHVINQATREILGNHIWQAGAEKTTQKGRLDVTHFKAIDKEELNKIEKLSNQIIMDNRKVSIHELERGQAERKFGFRIYQGGAVPGKILRIIDVENWDAEACGGTHVKNTGEIGLIKITNSERIQDGVVRIEYVAGNKAIEYIQNQEKELVKISDLLNVPLDQVYRATEKFFKRSKELQKKITRLQLSLDTSGLEYDIISEKFNSRIAKVEIESDHFKDLINFGSNILNKFKKRGAIVLFGKGKGLNIVLITTPDIAKNIRAGNILKNELIKFNVRGGGKDDLGQGSAPINTDIDKLSLAIKELIEERLGKH
jgi:alanyl-tRNA synthetase